MIFSCTKKVLDKVKKHHPVLSEKTEVGFYNWYVDLLNLERKNYFLFTHSQTLFSFFLYAGTKAELQNLQSLFEQHLQEMVIREIGTNELFLKEVISSNADYQFMKTNSRQVLGSMNDFKFQIKVMVDHHGPLMHTQSKINHLINTIPMGALKYQYPVNAMKEAILERLN